MAASALAQDIGTSAQQQIATIVAAKANFTAAQQKMGSDLAFAAMAARNDVSITSVISAISSPPKDASGGVVVDIAGNVSTSLLNAISSAGGTVLNQSGKWNLIHASLPLNAVETVAAHPDVQNIRSAPRARVNGALPSFRKTVRKPSARGSITARTGLSFVGALTSQGYISHSANLVINNMAINGTGVTVGVLSDSASPARIAALIGTGDLPVGTHALPGQDGSDIPGFTDEGAAMMEIIHDIAPGANLIFATAFNGVASFASNILALQAAGAQIIVDDVTYFDEGVFQEGPIAQAVSQVTALGATYFSSAANSGDLTHGTSGTWEGDFLPNGAAGGVLAGAGTLHNFGTVGSPQNFDVLTAITDFISLKWSDPLGGSSNDYDLYVLNNTGTTVKAFSATAQTGVEDPFEFVFQGTNCGTINASGYCPVAGDRIVVVLFSGAGRALHLDTERGRLSIGTSGATFGHNAGVDTVSMAATYWNSAKTGTKPFTGAANPTEPFSSDGPRKLFYTSAGAEITPGNVLFNTNGGTTLQKPDLTAADGGSTKTPGFNPFFGTSAAAPHAAGIAALVLSAKPGLTPAQLKTAMINGTVDNMAPGVDRDAGYGIVMATLAVQYALAH